MYDGLHTVHAIMTPLCPTLQTTSPGQDMAGSVPTQWSS